MFGQPQTSSPFATPGSNTNTPFGSTPVAPSFGSPAPATGGLFGGGATTNTSTSGFGMTPAQTTGFGGFGSPTPVHTTSGFGGFASPAPAFGAPATSTTTLPFGAPTPTTGGLFGSAVPTSASGGGMFGGGSTTTGVFGSTKTTTTLSGFGGLGSAPSTSAGFGTTPAVQTSTFRPPAPSTGLFGSGPTPDSSFGSTTTTTTTPTFGSPVSASTGLFGSIATTPVPTTGGIFGSSAPTATTSVGTSAQPYQVTTTLDGNTQINIQTITGMPVYDNRSLEELRYEDYLGGNRGSMGKTQLQPTGVFGSTTTAPSLSTGFRSITSNSTFGAAPSPSGIAMFGSPAPSFSSSSFATPSVAPVFGEPVAASTTSNSAFAPPATTSSGGLFASSSSIPSSMSGGEPSFGFGTISKSPATSGGLFSSAPAPAGGDLFGSATSVSGISTGLFGSAPAPGINTLFGSVNAAPATSGPFVSSPAASASATGNLFGSISSPAVSGGLFGTSASVFGTASVPSTGGLFGAPGALTPVTGGVTCVAPTPAGGGVNFGSTSSPASGGLFGSNATPKPNTGILFGNVTPTPLTGGLFGNAGTAEPTQGEFCGKPPTMTNPTPAGDALFGSFTPTPTVSSSTPVLFASPSVDTFLAQQLAAVEKQKQELALLDAWRSSSGSSKPRVLPFSLSERDINGEKYLSSYSSAFSPCGFTSAQRSAAKIRPRGFRKVITTNRANVAGKVGSGITKCTGTMLSPKVYLAASAKHLVIKPGALTLKPKMRLCFKEGDFDAGGSGDQVRENDETVRTHKAILDGDYNDVVSTRDYKDFTTNENASNFVSPDSSKCSIQSVSELCPMPISTADNICSISTSSQKNPPKIDENAYDFYKQVIEFPIGREELSPQLTLTVAESPIEGHSRESVTSSCVVPKLTKEGYTVIPTIETLTNMSENGLASVSGFVVSRDGYGSVAWDGSVDVRSVNLDIAISIEAKDVAVYDVEEYNGTKPPVGTKLNCPAVITLHNVYPKHGGKDATKEVKEKFERKIIKSTKKMGTELLLYQNGIWKFRVAHFSRYGLENDTDKEDD